MSDLFPTPSLRLSATLAAAVLALGCERADPIGVDDSASFTQIQENVFAASCAVSGCHVGPAAPEGLDLSAGAAYDNLVGVASNQVPELQRVDPGDPDDSYLVIKLEGGNRIADATARMPRGRDPLSEDQIATIRSWIADGAPRN